MFSIIIPIYNSEKFLKQCIDSVLNQTFNNYEVILINDGSTDKSNEICESYTRLDSRITYYEKDNGGQFSARLLGIKKSSGKYILPLDSDDMLRYDSLEIIYNILKKTEFEVLIYNGSRDISYKNSINNLKLGNLFSIEEKQKEIIYNAIVTNNNLNSFCMKCYSRELLNKIEWNEDIIKKMRIGEDMMQMLPVLTNAKHIGYCDQILYYYRINNDSVSHNYNYTYYETRKVIHDTLIKSAIEWGIDSKETIEKINLRTMRNIVSIIKSLMNKKIHIRKFELERIYKDVWWKNIYNVVNKRKLSISEKFVLFMLDKRLTTILAFYIDIFKYWNFIKPINRKKR